MIDIRISMTLFYMVYDALIVKGGGVSFLACTTIIWNYLKAEYQNNDFDVPDQKTWSIWLIKS